MKTNSQLIRNAILFFGVVFLFSGMPANGQGAAAQSLTQQRFVPARVTETPNDLKTTVLKGNVHPMARPEFDQGPVSDAMPATRMLLVLQRSGEQETALRQLLDQQQDKTSPNYHAWLTPQQFAKQFGPADADVQAITGWLQSHGFQNVKVGAGRTTVEFSGNVGQLRSAFHTDIHQFSVHGEQHFANVSDPQIPSALAPVISGVMGLHNFRPKSQMHRATNFQKEEAKVIGIKPSVTFTGCGPNGTQECYGVAPADFATIYNVPTGTLTGAGVNIAIVQDSNVNLTDIEQFRGLFGLSNNFTASNVIFNGPDPGVQGPDSATFDEGEAVLDVEWSGAVAPAATINLVVSETSQTLGVQGIDLSSVYIVDNNFAPILSESFGACEASLGANGAQFYGSLWEQAAAQGITVIISAGDSGSDGCDAGSGDFATSGLGINGLASTPFNVAMGGTDFQNGASPSVFWSTTGTSMESAKSYIPEETWNSSCAATATSTNLTTCTASIINADSLNEDGIDLAAGSGGQSISVPKPAWQTGVTPAADTFRDIPDLSLFSAVNTTNNDFYITCEQDTPSQGGNNCSLVGGQQPEISPVGGTSAAAPAFAGIMALIIQQQGGARQGNANYVLYQLFKKDASTATLVCPSTAANVTTTSCIFYDVITGNNSVACAGGSTNCSNKTATAGQFGVLVDPSNLTNPAFVAASGYDKATGLGSVNVAKLASAWGTASFDSTTTTIPTSPSGTIAHGATVTFTVNVTSGSGTPTGSVSLLATPAAGPPVAIGPFDNTSTSTFVLASGSATITTNILPGNVVGGVAAAYPVVAQYAGDGTFGASTSAPVDVTVGQEGSATAVSLVGSLTATTATYGSPYIMRVDVVGTGASSGSQQCTAASIPCPTGTISLTDNGNNLNDFQNTQTGTSSNTATLPNDLGFLEDQLIQLPGGTNSLVAKYSGDTSYTGSTSPALVVTVGAATTTSSVTASATSAGTTTPVTLTAFIATQSSGAGPTGTVTFSANGTSLGTGTVLPTAAAGLNTVSPVPAFGTATLSHTFSTAGTYAISVSYATGDANYANSSSSGTGNTSITVTTATAGSFVIAAGPATVATTAAASGTMATGTSAITITPSGGFAGAVTVTCGTIPGVSCTALTLPSGTTTGSLTINVGDPSSSMTAMAVPDTKNLWAANTLNRSNTSGAKGWWTLSAGTGFAALFLLFLPGGRKRYRAALGLGLVCVLSFTLGCGGGSSGGGGGGTTPTTTHLTISATKVVNSPTASLTVSATVSGGTPTGTVEFVVDGAVLGGNAALTNGSTGNISVTASQAPTFLQLVGTHTVSAHYSGDATTAASASGTLNVTVTGTTSLPITGTSGTATATSNVALTIN